MEINMWQIINGKLIRKFEFESQTDLANFLVQIAQKADELNHHPDIFVAKAFHLKLELLTHTENKISDLDYQLAEIINEIFAVIKTK